MGELLLISSLILLSKEIRDRSRNLSVVRRRDRTHRDSRLDNPRGLSTSEHPQINASTVPGPEYIRINHSKRKSDPVELVRFDHLVASHVNVGYSTLDKVKVDCKLLLSKTKWGTLGAGSPMFSAEVPACIMYMDLTFDQPKDCRLSSATVQITVDDKATELEDFRKRLARSQKSGSATRKKREEDAWIDARPVQITDWFGPKAITGKERIVRLDKHLRATPDLGFAGLNVGGIGYDRDMIEAQPSRWTFTGRIIAAGAGPKNRQGRAKGEDFLYRGLRWTLSENDLEPQAAHSPVIHIAFAFVHGGESVLLRIQIEGKLRGMGAK